MPHRENINKEGGEIKSWRPMVGQMFTDTPSSIMWRTMTSLMRTLPCFLRYLWWDRLQFVYKIFLKRYLWDTLLQGAGLWGMTSPGCGEEHVPFGLCLTLIFHNMTFPWGSLCIHWKSRVSYLDYGIIQLYFLLHLLFAASFTLGTINEPITFILPQSETSLMMRLMFRTCMLFHNSALFHSIVFWFLYLYYFICFIWSGVNT